ncbi:MAG: M15 family metallopeptidase [Simkania sp.]|nr:M15 family metallopeptidase [Simkania sp.]
MIDSIFIDLEYLDSSIKLDIRYATNDNFLGRPVYPIAKCFLRKPVALKLQKVHQMLKKQGLGIKVYDGYRPLSVQKIFWDFLPDERYVANPVKGSRHNRGAAVDVTVIDAKGQELLMPTVFDDFTEKAHRDCMDMAQEAIQNRNFLEEVMSTEGFIGLSTEWWHFDDAEWEAYSIEDISFMELVY